MQPYDACRLLALNLTSFVVNPYDKKNAYFDYDFFYRVAYEQQVMADNIVDLEIEHIDRILNKIETDPEPEHIKRNERDLWTKIREVASSGRRTGCGFTGLGDMLAMLGLKYDDALYTVDLVMRTKMRGELDASIDMAIERGPFKGWDRNKEFIPSPMYDFPHDAIGANDFYQMLFDEFNAQAQRMYQYGRRNISFSTVAPTGSVSILTQTTSGLEPVFNWGYMRRKKVNPSEKDVNITFVDQNGDSWEEYPVLHHEFKRWLELRGIKNVDSLTKEEVEKHFSKSPWAGCTANDIDWLARVELQGVIQKYTSHSISSTINLPNDVKEEEVSKIYLHSWDKGLKGVTIYRDGCRTGVLVTEPQVDSFDYADAYKRPKELDADLYNAVSKGQNYHVFVGHINGKPYEVFARLNDQHVQHTKGKLIKRKKGVYCFSVDDEILYDNITEQMSPEEEAVTRLLSWGLRHKADIKFAIEQLGKTNGDLTSFSKVLARTLKRYIPDGSKSTATCLNCGSHNVIFEEGCEKCLDCGSSKCG